MMLQRQPAGGHPDEFHTGVIQQIVDVPMFFFGLAQMPVQPGGQPARAESAANVSVSTRMKIKARHLADLDSFLMLHRYGQHIGAGYHGQWVNCSRHGPNIANVASIGKYPRNLQ